MGYRLLSILFLLSLSVTLRAQDIHFSQMDANPLLLNPAYAGFFEGNGRFGLAYRNQWATVSTPFQTFAVTGEAALKRSANRRRGVSLGLMAYNDVAGTLSYGTLSGGLTLAGYTVIGRHHNHILSAGIEGGYAQAGFNPDNAEMEDPSEHFDQRETTYPLLGAGIAWYCQASGDLTTKAGFSVRNINRPNISYMQLDDTYLEPRYTIHFRAEYRCWQSVSLRPIVMAQLQKNYHEILYGMDVKWHLEESAQLLFSLGGGLCYRHGDALLANLMMEYNAFVFNFCYDANISKLTSASKSIGAFEVGLIYRIGNGRQNVRAIKCPVF